MCKELLTVVYTLNSMLRMERISPISKEAQFPEFIFEFEKSLELIKTQETRQLNEFDLELVKVFQYHLEETKAAKDVLIKRARAKANFERSKRDLERAKQTCKNIPQLTQASQVSLDYPFRLI